MPATSPHSLRRTLSALAGLALAVGACKQPPELLPPPFGPDVTAPKKARLFFPTGMALAPGPSGALDWTAHLLVVNGNFNHEFASGTLVSLDPLYLKSKFDRDPASVPTDPLNPGLVAEEDIPNDPSDPVNGTAFPGVAMIGNYGGPLSLDASGRHAYTGSRDTNTINAVTVEPATGELSCYGGDPSDRDCRAGLVDTRIAYGLEGPYAIVPGLARLPGSTTDHDVLFVSALIPSVDYVDNGVIYTHAPLVALLQDSPTTPLYQTQASNIFVAGGIGAGPVIFDQPRRRLVLGGCYTRFASGTDDYTSGKCGTTRTGNLIRFMSVDEANNADVQAYDIQPETRGLDTVDLQLGGFDASGVAHTLYALVRSPDMLVEMDLPDDPLQLVRIRRVTPMPSSPSLILVLRRPASSPGSDLLLISSEGSGNVDVFDTSAGQVVAEVDQVGLGPFALVALPDSDDGARAQIAVSVFSDCRVALLDVDYAHPWQARLRARLGSCPL